METMMTGNHAQSLAAKLARVQVVAAYPITPQTTIVERIAEMVASGEFPAQFLEVESEHSALQACISAAAVGARTYTATSSQGLLLMHELLHWASGLRVPIVMGVVNRAVAPPWTIYADHTDSIAQRDTGWIQYYAESNQEVLDTVLQAYRLAEDAQVLLPAMVCEDAFYLSHTFEPAEVPDADLVDDFLPPLVYPSTLTVDDPARLGSFMPPDQYMEHRRGIADAMEHAARLIPEVEAEYMRTFGRDHGGALPTYLCDDADAVLVVSGTAAPTARAVARALRADGYRVGVAKLRVFRPFPVAAMRALAAHVPRVAVLDRSFTFGFGGALFQEVRNAVQSPRGGPLVRGFVAGLGGRDLVPATIRGIFLDALAKDEPDVTWAGLREVPG
ncbi:MAG TPA: transketolase C-terminal domain-containing protein [Thermoplasmata archaeon]|nr:transketolase C-terminal domain-containing protein [Thermoplasmata archaeon]